MTKPTKWVRAQRRLRSAWASALSEQSLRCPHEESLGPYLLTECTAETLIRLGGCPGWSESSLGAHSFCWFCHVAISSSGKGSVGAVRSSNILIYCCINNSTAYEVILNFIRRLAYLQSHRPHPYANLGPRVSARVTTSPVQRLEKLDSESLRGPVPKHEMRRTCKGFLKRIGETPTRVFLSRRCHR